MALSTTRRLPIEQNVGDLVEEAKHRWLKAGEIFMILHNYKELQILASRRLHRPPSGSLFVIEPQRLREFKKDGYEWSKKKDGKTIQEAHENLKVNGVDTVECLYAHLEINENFQRRIYRWTDKKTVNIVLLHYLQKYFNPIVDPLDNSDGNTIESLRQRFENLLSLSCSNCNTAEFSLEEKFHLWLKKLAENGDVPTVLAVEMMHLTAALGYTPALQAIIGAAKIDVNSSDKNGFTVLHWAAKFGRMHTVEFLISEGAAPLFPSVPEWNTAADLAYAVGHHKIGDYLKGKEELAFEAWELPHDEDFDTSSVTG